MRLSMLLVVIAVMTVVAMGPRSHLSRHNPASHKNCRHSRKIWVV